MLAEHVRWQVPVIFSRQNKHRWKLLAAQWLKAPRTSRGKARFRQPYLLAWVTSKLLEITIGERMGIKIVTVL